MTILTTAGDQMRGAVDGDGPDTGATERSTPGPSRRSVPARWRIVAWITVLVAAGLASVIVVVDATLRTSIDQQANTQLTRSLSEFEQFVSNGGVGPSGRAPTSVQEMMESYLRLRYPQRGEALLGFPAGSPVTLVNRGPETPPQDATGLLDPAILTAITEQPSGVTSTRHGTMRWARSEIRTPDGVAGRLVAVVFTRPMLDDVARTRQLLIIVSLVTLAASAAASWFVAGQILKPVRLVQRAAAEITEKDLTRRIPVRGTDDVAELATTFNAMLDRLDAAFTTEQRFVDDAGHELRTPITIIRGHLELMGDHPEERSATVALVTQELDRMSRIVSDLLVLAKAERPDFVQVAGPVDVTELTVELDALVAPLGDRRWQVSEVAEGVCPLDRQRIVQAVLQLAQNAVQHTDPGGRIDLASRFVTGTDGHRLLEFSVTDDGPGVAADDRRTIFERFTHGVRSGSAQRGGAGLGLAIVAAIAEGHGGRATVTDAPSGGARFTITVPAGDPVRSLRQQESSPEPRGGVTS